MSEMSAKVLKYRITNFEFHIGDGIKPGMQLQVDYKPQMRTPKDEESRSVWMSIRISIMTADEAVRAVVEGDLVFELESVPENHYYTEIADRVLTPMALQQLLNAFDDMLVAMGHGKMGLAVNFVND